jgi:hypothetical protein
MFTDIVMLDTPAGGEGWSALRMEAKSGGLSDMSGGMNVTIHIEPDKDYAFNLTFGGVL